jgi:hypothetical protein
VPESQILFLLTKSLRVRMEIPFVTTRLTDVDSSDKELIDGPGNDKPENNGCRGTPDVGRDQERTVSMADKTHHEISIRYSWSP